MHLMMRTETFAKLFFMVSFSGLLMYTVLAFYSFHTAYTTVYDFESYHTSGLPKPIPYTGGVQTDNELKYILIWTTSDFKKNVLSQGQGPFVKNNCSCVNCYMSTDKNLLKGYHRDFDAIFVDVGVLRQSRWKSFMPHHRTMRQKYVFHSMRSAEETPICNVKADSYFNWTWSYKIFSDISTPFIEVKDKAGQFVAPRTDVKWIENMSALTEKDIEKLKTKKKAVAWIPENCKTKTDRFDFAKKLEVALKDHSLELDIFGCHMGSCPKKGCMQALESDYYFYLASESSYTEDYVTEEVLKAYHYNTVPIVRGGADYRYFLPEGSYINAGSGSVEKLASLIDYSIRNPSVYHSFHQWKYHYSIQAVDHNRGLCDLCAMLNDKQRVNISSSYEKFRKWWYSNLRDRCYPKGAEEIEEFMSYMNDSRRKAPKN